MVRRSELFGGPAEVRPAESLADLAALANSAAEKGVESLRAAGEALLKARALCKHGDWMGWLRKNIKYSPQHARRLMRLAEQKPPRFDTGSHLDALADPVPWEDEPEEEPPPESSNGTSGSIWSGNNSAPRPVRSQTSGPTSPPPPPPPPARPWAQPASDAPGPRAGVWTTEWVDGKPEKVLTEEMKRVQAEWGVVPTDEDIRAAIDACRNGVPPRVRKAMLVARALKQADDLNFSLISLGEVCAHAPGLSDTKPVVDRLFEMLKEFEPTNLDKLKRVVAEWAGKEGN